MFIIDFVLNLLQEFDDLPFIFLVNIQFVTKLLFGVLTND